MLSIAECKEYEFNAIQSSPIWNGFPNVEGKSVFVKPNLVTPPTVWDRHATTQPEILEVVLGVLKANGARDIIVGECGFKGQWAYTMELSKYPEICRKYGAKLICVQDGENYHKYTLRRFENKSDYLSLYGIKISNYVLEADVVINLPKLKVHNMAYITGAIKNMMGVIQPKGSMHPGASSEILHKRLRDLYCLMKPIVSWTLMDGIVGMEYSEQFGVPKKSGILISGTDMWEVDWMASQIIGMNPHKIPYLKYISQMKDSNRPVWSDNIIPFELPLSLRKKL